MTYPPDHHLLRDLGFSTESGPGWMTTRLPITPGLMGVAGLRLGVLASMIDVSGASIAIRSAVPDWIATADLSVHLIQQTHSPHIDIRCEPLRVGKNSIVVAAEIIDNEGELCGLGRIAFSRIPGSATKASIDELQTSEVRTIRSAIQGGSPIHRPIAELCGFNIVGPGQLRFEKTSYVSNSFGTINGGVLALAADEAAVSASGGSCALDLKIQYLEQVGGGPIGVTAEVVRSNSDASDMLVTVRIEDKENMRLVAVSDVTVQAI